MASASLYDLYTSLNNRNRVSITADDVAGVAAEALLSVVKTTDGVSAAASTSVPVAAGKRLRLQSMTFSVRSTAAAVANCKFRLRVNPSGAATLASPVEFTIDVSTGAAVGSTGSITVSLGDELEFPAGSQIAVTHVGVTGEVVSVSLNGFEYEA